MTFSTRLSYLLWLKLFMGEKNESVYNILLESLFKIWTPFCHTERCFPRYCKVFFFRKKQIKIKLNKKCKKKLVLIMASNLSLEQNLVLMLGPKFLYYLLH